LTFGCSTCSPSGGAVGANTGWSSPEVEVLHLSRSSGAKMTPHLPRIIFAHLPSRTSKEAQTSWKLAEKIAKDVVAEGERVGRVTANADLPSTK